MTISPQKPQTEPQKLTEPTAATEQEFDWQNCWYPVTFIKDLPLNRPYSFSLYDEPLVLFRDQQGKLGALSDVCCHRAATLSTGQLLDGKIECLYHGWQFNTEGQCVHIPQLAEGATIPRNACVRAFRVVERQGIIWLWAGQAEAADESTIPTVADLEQEGIFLVDTVVDLPYDQTYLVENFLDPAHVPISHDRTELKQSRDMAKPLEMETWDISAKGFEGRYRKLNNSPSLWYSVKFIAPHLVRYEINIDIIKMKGGFALYAFPLGHHRSRVLVRRYGNFFSRWFRLKPRWLEHLRQNKLLEEDLPDIVGQCEYIENSGKTLKEIFLPLKTSDVFVVEYRKWLDKFASKMPFYDGYTTSKRPDHSQEIRMPLDRYERHISICSSCNQAYNNTIRLKQIFIGVAIALAAIAILVESEQIKVITVIVSLLAVISAVMAGKLKTHFERVYIRSPK